MMSRLLEPMNVPDTRPRPCVDRQIRQASRSEARRWTAAATSVSTSMWMRGSSGSVPRACAASTRMRSDSASEIATVTTWMVAPTAPESAGHRHRSLREVGPVEGHQDGPEHGLGALPRRRPCVRRRGTRRCGRGCGASCQLTACLACGVDVCRRQLVGLVPDRMQAKARGCRTGRRASRSPM